MSKWTVVGNGKKPKSKPSSDNMPGIEELKEEQVKQSEQKNPWAEIKTFITDKILDLPDAEQNKIFGDIVAYALNILSDKMNVVLEKASKIDNNQQAVVLMASCLGKIKKFHPIIKNATNDFEQQVRNLHSGKETRMIAIKQFLIACGIETAEKVVNTSQHPPPKSDPRMSYASAIGSTVSALVVDCVPAQISPPKPCFKKINCGIVDIEFKCVNDPMHLNTFEIGYVNKTDTFAMRVGKEVYTMGPGQFIDRYSVNGRTERAKRCENNPCTYKASCGFYHDPVVVSDHFHKSRNFALSYVTKMIKDVKDDNTILDTSEAFMDNIDDYIRDIYQVAGILIMTATKLKSVTYA